MPTPRLVPLPQDLQPQWPPEPQQRPSAAEARAIGNQRIEKAAGPLKPLAQFANALASPDTKMGIFTGPINGVSKLGNALGDLVQRKPIDVSDAWTINDQTARALNPWRLGTGQEVTPADEAGLALGEGIGAELAGAATGATLLRGISQLAAVKKAADALKATQAVKSFAVATKVNTGLRAGVNVSKNVGQALVGTALAAPFLDQEDGNLANLANLPGSVQKGDNYLQALGKGLLVEGIAGPLALAGAGALIKPIRQAMANGNVAWLDELANAELEPYVPKPFAPQLPAAGQSGAPQLPGYTQTGGALVPYDSAIGRSLQEQTQIRQVSEQRKRLQDMGLVQQGEGGQLELSLGGAVDPQIRTQVRQLQTQRGQLIKQGMESGEDVTQQLGEIDQQIGDLIQSGNSADYMPGERFSQPELDLPDPRPELDTFLAHLDELDDKTLREIHSRVWRQDAEVRQAREMEAAQLKVQEVSQRIAEIQAKADAGEVTPTGAKRMLGKAQKELDVAQQAVLGIEARARVPEALVGDQLSMKLDQQLGLAFNPEIKLPPFKEVAKGASEFGYRTPDDYRSALQGWNRDLLRKLAMPDSSPEVAALVKANTGRRVWQAKKQDIIDALVEISERRGRYLPPEPEQLQLGLTTNKVGADAPLFDEPAKLDVPGMGKVLDADGNEVVVPVDDYSGRGMDAATRERLKAQVLQRAIDNGEVQAPVTPIPDRPTTTFKQGSLVDELLADPEGQLPLLFANDALPTYKASGKNADALIEEMRLRLEYQVLDDAAQQAQRQAYMAEHGWDMLSWEEKKKLGILDEGFYSLKPYSDRFREPTPAFNPDGQPLPPREPKVYRMGPDGEMVDEAAIPKPTKEEAIAAKKQQAAEAKTTKAAVKAQNQALAKRREALLKQREELLRQSQGANC